MSKWRVIGILYLFVIIGLLSSGCSGESETSSRSQHASTQLLSGVAAAGAPINGIVYLKDSETPHREISSIIAADGSFSLDVSSLTAPFLIKAVGTVNGDNLTLFSFSTVAGVTNINPLSHLVVAVANGSDDLTNLYDNPDPTRMQAIKDSLSSSMSKVQTVLQPTLSRFEAANTNFISDSYVTNHQKLDLFLDLVSISVNNGNVTIVDKTANNSISSLISSFLTDQIDIIPTVPAIGSVCILPGASFVSTIGTVNFKAVVTGSPNQQVIWSVIEESGGTITSSGGYGAPLLSGTYHVKATSVADTAQSSTAMVTVLPWSANKTSATVTLGNLITTYNGKAQSVTAITDPPGLTVSFYYNGSATAPQNAGSYYVVGLINDTDYQGFASGTLVIKKLFINVIDTGPKNYDGTTDADITIVSGDNATTQLNIMH